MARLYIVFLIRILVLSERYWVINPRLITKVVSRRLNKEFSPLSLCTTNAIAQMLVILSYTWIILQIRAYPIATAHH